MKKNTCKITVIAALTLVFALFIENISDFYLKCSEIRENTIRLHVIANSDSATDQNLKLLVRDAIIDNFSAADSALDKSQAEDIIKGSLAEIIAEAQEVVRSNGYNYNVGAELCTMYFDTKDYGSFTMPAGEYDALRIIIGSGSGKNWWCVMFPPLCLPASQENINIKEYFGDSSEILIKKPKYKVKFAIVELYEKIVQAFKSI